MARKSDPTRMYQARRDAIASRLIGSGVPQADAERWLATLTPPDSAPRRCYLRAMTGKPDPARKLERVA